jgi:hypothetical protein
LAVATKIAALGGMCNLYWQSAICSLSKWPAPVCANSSATPVGATTSDYWVGRRACDAKGVLSDDMLTVAADGERVEVKAV